MRSFGKYRLTVMKSQDKSCKYEVGEGKDKVKVNIPDGKSKNVECNKCTCSDGVLECTEIACAES